MKTLLLKRAKKQRALIENTTLGEKLYLIGLCMIFWGLLVLQVFEKLGAQTALFGMIIFTGGLVYEAMSIVKTIWVNTYGKVIISSVVALLSTITLASSASILANITGTNPSSFPYTLAFISFLQIPFNILMALLVIAIVSWVYYFFIGPLLFIANTFLRDPAIRYTFRLKKKPRKERYFWLFVGLRIFATGFLIHTVFLGSNYLQNYANFVVAKSSAFLFELELYKKTHCDKDSDKEKIGYINNKLILAGTKLADGSHSFEVRACSIS